METLTYNREGLISLDDRFRGAFINSLGGFKSVVLVGTRSGSGASNLAIFSSLFHIGANPPLCGLIFRPDTVYRHTLENIMETGEYTINHLTEAIYKQAHQTSARYDRSVSEFEVTGLEECVQGELKAPYVRESKVQFGMKLEERTELKINGTILVIGRIVETFVPQSCLQADGSVDLERAGTVTLSGLDSYHLTRKLSRLTYAKPGTFPAEITPDRQ